MGAPDPAVTTVARSGARPFGAALVAALRPAQWTKNAALLAPLLFARRATDAGSVARAALALVAFCAVASAGYLANDVVDRERDRRHPVKRSRPVASGELGTRAALVAALALAGGGLAAAAVLGRAFLAATAGYLALVAIYTHALKNVAIVDVFAVAAGFVLRVIAGGIAVDVPISNWLYLCTLLLALFLALAKRRSELALLSASAGEHRAILGQYSIALLDQLLTVVSACTALAYALYTLAPETIEKFQGDRLKFTIPFVLFGLFRYLHLVHRRGEGGEPERVLLRDPALQLDIAGWLATVVWAIYARH